MGKNKIKFGLTNVHYAVVSEGADGTVSYGTPKRLYGAAALNGKANTERENIPADDISDYVTMHDNKGYDGELELLDADDDFRTEVLGETKDSNGVIIENKDAVPKKIALLFEMSGDVSKTRFAFYNCSVTKPDIEADTKGEKIEHKTDKIAFTASPAHDTGNIKAKVTEGSTAYTNWYKSVYLTSGQPAVLITPTEVIFDKAMANQKEISFNLMGGATLTSIKNDGTALTKTTHYTDASGVVTLKTAYLSTLPVGETSLVFTFGNSQTRNVKVTVIDTTN